METPSVAVMGCGAWGFNHVRVMHELGALRVACDPSPERRAEVERRLPGTRTCASLAEVLADDAVRAVVVAAPAESHYELARACLRAGRDVLVEKPLALTARDGREMAELADREARVLMVGHLLRYHPAAAELKRLVAAGTLGRIQYIYSQRLNLGRVRREENILWSFAPHDISLILWLLGEEMPATANATGGSYLHPKIADVTVTNLEFPSGARAHIFVSWLHPFKEQRLVVIGERGMARFDDVAPHGQKLSLFAHEIRWIDGVPVPKRAEPEHVQVSTEEALVAEDRHFLARVADRGRPLTDGWEGVRVLEVLEASGRSLESGGAPVRPASAPAPALAAGGASAAAGPRDYFVHPSAFVDEPCEIGAGTKVWHFAHVMKNARIGRGCILGQNVHIAPEVVVGHGVKIQNNVSLYTGCVIEDDVFIGPSAVFTNVGTPRSEVNRHEEYEPTVVERGATVGANATVVCGHRVGRYAFVGAGAVVTHDVPPHALVLGAPARVRGWMCRCGERLPLPAEPAEGARTACARCATAFTFAAGALVPAAPKAA
ncbi:MAG TPA: Gfo/Idh/MocA family oxidoreductase [Myxococcota bacterium]|jgi:UDP-2-acetamido-3-amino-2,3-dideoxy-glucuronate N-acetyltransferase|nr:Gfo/Idh/MocA family oxidoreductase [Myxococcota bacterium]